MRNEKNDTFHEENSLVFTKKGFLFMVCMWMLYSAGIRSICKEQQESLPWRTARNTF